MNFTEERFYQTLNIEVGSGTVLGTITDTEVILDNGYDVCDGIVYSDLSSANNFFVSIRNKGKDILQEMPNAIIEVGDGDSDKRFLSVNFPAAGQVITVRTIPVANTSGETQIYVIFRLRKRERQ